jgi:hypothetical protein
MGKSYFELIIIDVPVDNLVNLNRKLIQMCMLIAKHIV